MDAFAKLSFLATSLVLLTVGVRLLWVWRRTRQVPELAIGLAYTLGIIGLFVLVATTPQARAGKEVFATWLVGHVGVQLGQAALIVGVWKIFYPRVPLAARAAWAGLAVCGLSILVTTLRGRVELYTGIDAYVCLGSATGFFGYAWIAQASWRYAGQLNRRRALGLADTLSIWRFRCWAAGGSMAGLVMIVSLCAAAFYHVGLSSVPWMFLLTQGLLIVSSTSTWLAFFPPAFYKRLAASRDAALAAPEGILA